MSTDYLKISDAALAQITENSNDAIIAIQRDQRIIFFNKTAEVMFGYKRREVLGKHLSMLIPPSFHAAHEKHVEDYAEHGKTVRDMHGLGSSLPALRKNGTEFQIEAQLSKIRVGKEEICSVSIRDVTKREAMVRDAVAGLKEEFLANVSHELRTPINSIYGYIRLVLDSIVGEVPDGIRHALERADIATQYLAELIEGLIQFSKISKGKIPFTAGPLNLHSFVKSAIEMVSHQIGEKKIFCKCVSRNEKITAVNDRRYVMQIVLNFLTNAIKFTDKGGILVSFGEHDGYIWIRVADSGRGISSRKLEQIFEPFVQLRNRDALQGLGIGLATGMRLAQSMGGRISVTSEVGKGSAFTLRIPKVVESMKPLED